MKVNFWKKTAAALALLLIQPVGISLYYAGNLPDSYYVRQGEGLELSTLFPISAAPAESTAAAAAVQDPRTAANLKLFGIIPIKTVSIQSSDTVMLVPGGEAFGIRMLMDGIMVIGFGDVCTESGSCCPAAEAGIQEGDIIQAVGSEPVTSTEDFRQKASDGSTMQLTVLRGETELPITVTPAYSCEAGCFQTGLWVRDSAAGIGTVTYYEPSTGRFGGLGHPICDTDTGERIPLGKGEADAVTISGVIRGQAGIPGQLQGYFSSGGSIGTLCMNSRCGIFGTLNEIPENEPAIPLGLKQEAVTGDAEILSTINGNTPKRYTIRITDIDYTDESQNLTIEVTDPVLLAETGGIVQGMSGSPILQNGRIIGAVTHVLVESPVYGFGIFAETMYDTAG